MYNQALKTFPIVNNRGPHNQAFLKLFSLSNVIVSCVYKPQNSHNKKKKRIMCQKYQLK